MFVLGLLTCITLRAFSTQAKVVTSFSECSTFFYKGKAPEGMDQNAKKICQKLQNKFYYATLYSVSHRIPLYSAYKLDSTCSDTGRKDIWHVEPQISNPLSPTDHMILEKDSDVNTIKGNQAVSSDYALTPYDRGHLNPNSFQCGEGRTATFTLTNAAPMDPCFNRVHWRNWETTLKRFIISKLNLDGRSATAYIVTGTVPNENVRIPQKETPLDSDRVTVPSHIWTAVCYKHNLPEKSFSFGYIGQNQPEHGVSLMTLSTLERRLRELSNMYRSLKIFEGYCYQNNLDEDEVEDKFEKLLDPILNVVMNSVTENTFNAITKATKRKAAYGKRFTVTELTAKLGFDSLSDYFYVRKKLKIFAKSNCLITKVRKYMTDGVTDLRKRDTAEGSDSIECQLFPDTGENAADGSPCSSPFYSSEGYLCFSEGKTKPWCSSPCLYKEQLNGYSCYSGQKMIECSPPYSLITAKGERCLSDHPCATYGYDYYWCRTRHGFINDDWEYCSPPLWRSKAENGKYCRSDRGCAKYDKSQPWCYTDDGKKQKCCTSDDCHSAVNDKTCKPDHPCGYHNEKYLWCYTTNGKWDYCCTSCA
ncbi:uncharacterized protein si:ch211-165i18.2 [Triplophysa dalaica]|uniref:uncharacterized protein si:ch211-165i18.2 n=1 Tax=Triplophysa dalaica TaxID=1582913 RepID=UPI0024E0264C|nr:uncharacterized protein si:ch211-165i18.2 [Triplophysa dalaica]